MDNRNKPKFNFFKNWGYAINGFFIAFKEELSFKLEVIIFVLIITAMILLKFSYIDLLFVIFSMSLVLIIELLNTAIEYAVDMITDEYNEMAKKSKDLAACAVMFGNFLLFGIILFVILKSFLT